MANNSYVIILKNETSNSESSPIASPSGGGSDSPKSGTNAPQTTKGNAMATNIVKGLVAYNTYVKPFVSQVIGHQINTVALRTGADEVQQRLQFAYEIGSAALGIGASILTGAAIGNVPGAIIGAVVGVTSTIMNYANKAQTIQLQSNLENITIRGLNIRAGGAVSSFNGSRGREGKL